MKASVLDANDVNIRKTLQENTIGRNEDVYDLCLLLSGIEDNYSISIEGGWGSGKTFFIKQTKLVLDELFKRKSGMGGEDDSILNAFLGYKRSKNIESLQSMMSVYYDAWEYDNSIDPLFSLIRCISKECEANPGLTNNKKVSEFFKGLTFSVGLPGVASVEIAPGQIIESFVAENYLSGIDEEISIRKRIDEFLQFLNQEKANRINVFIDELDRCKPDYAIRLLERIKHYFHHENITFVFSVNALELQHSIKHFYGSEFNATGYLDRFFDLRLSMPSIDMDLYYSVIGFIRHSAFGRIREALIEMHGFQLRQIARYDFITKKITPERVVLGEIPMSSEEKGIFFALTYMLPVIIALKLSDADKYQSFIDGKSFGELEFLYSEINFNYGLSNWLVLDKNEDKDKTQYDIQSNLRQAYDYLFLKENTISNVQLQIGDMILNHTTRKRLYKVLSDIKKYL